MSSTILVTDSKASGINFDKRIGTNLMAAALVMFGFWVSDPWSKILLNTGLFSLPSYSYSNLEGDMLLNPYEGPVRDDRLFQISGGEFPNKVPMLFILYYLAINYIY